MAPPCGHFIQERSREKSVTKNCIANGITVSYEEFGQGEPLVLLMGLGAPGSKWMPHIEAYKDHFHVYAPDNRGAGQSDKPVSDCYSIKEMAEDTIAFMDAVGIESAHFNGISMGGAIAQYIAVHYPRRVRSLVLTNTFARCGVSFRRSMEILRDACGQLDPVTSGRLTQWMIFAQPFQEENEQYMLDAEKADASYPHPMPAHAFKAQCNGILGFDILEDLCKIQAPTLIAAGDKDLFVPVSLAEEMAIRIPNATLYMAKDGGHVQHWEQLDAYNEVTLAFLLAHKQA